MLNLHLVKLCTVTYLLQILHYAGLITLLENRHYRSY